MAYAEGPCEAATSQDRTGKRRRHCGTTKSKAILQAMRDYTGPLNKKGLPQGRVHGTARQGEASSLG